jgi:DNA-binding MarR family transcriptional regulator
VAHPTFTVKRTYLAMRRAMEATLQPHGFTAAQFDVFQQLLHEDGLEHRVLQERLVIASPTLTSIIDGMVSRGLVERRISPEDARVKQLFLTAKAHALHDELDEAGQRFVATMFHGFSSHEQGLLLTWLERLTANLERGELHT